MKAQSPAFQFYPKDWLSDERVLRMDCAARGAYINLLAVCWMEDTLPQDDRALARLAGAYPSEWRRIRLDVLACFEQDGDGRYHHKRLDLERSKQQSYREKQAAKGRTSAERRFNRGSTVVQPEGVPEGNREARSQIPFPSVRTNTRTGADAPTAKSDAEKAADKDAGLFIKAFCDLWKAAHGGTYKVKPGKHVPLVRSLLKTYGHERLLQLANGLQTVEDKWIADTDRGLEILSSQINKLELWCAEEEARYAHR